MAYRRKVICLRLCRALIAANSAGGRQRLKGNLHSRSKSIRRANDLIAILHAAGDGREWARSKVDTVCCDLRKQASDSRLSADARLKAIERLMALDGLLGLDELGSDPMDEYIRSVVDPKPVETKIEIALTPLNLDDLEKEFREALQR